MLSLMLLKIAREINYTSFWSGRSDFSVKIIKSFKVVLLTFFLNFPFSGLFRSLTPLTLWTLMSLFVVWSSECNTYQYLTSADRKVTSTKTNTFCDDRLGPGWFRFQGAAGTRMPTTRPAIYSCNTDSPGWLNGRHPTVTEGKVTRTVCFRWSASDCEYSTNIHVANCGSFYIYYFSGTPRCWLRYCGSD